MNALSQQPLFSSPPFSCSAVNKLGHACSRSRSIAANDAAQSFNKGDYGIPLSVEDDDFLSAMIPSPPIDELEEMVYEMRQDVGLLQAEDETFETNSTNFERVVANTSDDNFVREPSEKDIISVRGFGKSRPGSLKFRELIRKHHHVYQRSESLESRRNLAKTIRDELLPGRFLKKDHQSHENYRVMDEEETLTKIMFAMRDCKTSAPVRATKPFASEGNAAFIKAGP